MSETTVVKGQFGLDQSGGTGKKLKYILYFTRYVRLPKPSLYKGKAAELQWINLIHSTHDSFCGCETPLQHLKHLLNSEECPPTTTTGDAAGSKEGADDPGFDEGDLERLFEEDTTADTW